MGKVSILTQSLLEPGCEDCSILDDAVKEYKYGNYSIITASSVSLGFLYSVSTVSDNSRPQLTPSIKYFNTVSKQVGNMDVF